MKKLVINLTDNDYQEAIRLLNEDWHDRSWPIQLALIIRRAIGKHEKEEK